MNTAVYYPVVMALLSLVAAGILDIVFKSFAVNVGGRGVYVAGCGLIWGAMQTIYFFISGTEFDFTRATLFYGVLAGASLAAANLIMIGCLKHLNVSLGSTIYRLNTVAVVILSIAFLGEPAIPVRLWGVGAGIAAVLLLYWPNRRAAPPAGISTTAAEAKIGFLRLILFASLLRAVYGVITKLGLKSGADANSMLLIAAAFWMIGGIVYAFIVRENITHKLRRRAAYIAVSGVIIYVVVNSLLEGLKYGDATVVIPIANMSFVLATAISIMVGMEKPALSKFIAVIFSVISIILISQSV